MITGHRRSLLRRAILVITVTLALILAADQRLLSTPFGDHPGPVHVERGLGLGAVLKSTQGPCTHDASFDTVWASIYDSCLTLDRLAIHVTNLRSAQVMTDGSTWWVRLMFNKPDEKAFTMLTATLRDKPDPRNELAIVLQGPPGGLVLAAPAVEKPLTYLDLDGGRTEASAKALLDSILQ